MATLLKKVGMDFSPVNYKSLTNNANKEYVIMREYDEVLTILLGECLKAKNLRTMQRLVEIVRQTRFPENNYSEFQADLCEAICLHEDKIEDAVGKCELPACVCIRVERIISAISQAIGFRAESWAKNLIRSASMEYLQSLKGDLVFMQSYAWSMYNILTMFCDHPGNNSYRLMRYEAISMIDDALELVKDRINHLQPDHGEETK